MRILKKYPLVSVVLAAFNGERFLLQQLDSIFKQTYPNFEVIAVDDASSDNTLIILNEFASKYKCMKVFSNENNIGFIKNFERACMLSSGDFIAPCDQDDVWEPKKIELMQQAIGEYSLIYCDLFVCNEKLEQTGKKLSDIVTCRDWNSCLQYAVFARIYGNTLLFTKQLFLKAAPFVDVVPHDWWIAYNATLQGGIKFLKEPLVKYRQHASNTFGIVGGKPKKARISKRSKRLIQKENARLRTSTFFHQCPDFLKKEKEVLLLLTNSYKSLSFKIILAG